MDVWLSYSLSSFLLFTPQTYSKQHVIEQLPGTADKRLALAVFICARGFTHDQPVSLLIANTKYSLCT